MDIKELICKLTAPMGVSGAEKKAADTAAELLAPFGEVSVTALGSVICKVGEHREGLPSLLLDAHIDEIGMIVTAAVSRRLVLSSPPVKIENTVF